MLRWPLRSPFRASSRLPGGTRRSVTFIAALTTLIFRRATRLTCGPGRRENALAKIHSASRSTCVLIIKHGYSWPIYVRQVHLWTVRASGGEEAEGAADGERRA